ncbi:MAG TPA: hypothetical protein VLJ60_06830 [bacterium]|nr:hypothetical protein [bacterium]
MTLKKVLVLLFAALFILPLSAADDFDDEFGGFDDFEDEGKKKESKNSDDEDYDAEDSAEKKKEKDQEASDAAMKDLLGDEEEEEIVEKETKKKDKKESKKSSKTDEPKKEKKPAEPKEKGLKPVILVKGGFTLLGQYKTAPKTTLGSMFGGVDEGLLGAEFIGDHVIAKGTMNIRTENPLIEKGNNPLAKKNLHTIQNGAENGLFELYGGLKFFDIFVKAGKMLPEYGLVDTYQTIGMGFTTPFLTRSLIAVEGFIPETDAGIALGYKGTFADAHTILVGLMLGTGSVASDFWNSDKTMGLYGRLGYMHEYIQAAIGFQYRKDYFNDAAYTVKLKNATFIGIGVHLRASVAGFEMPVTFDFNQMDMYQKTTAGTANRKPAQNMLLSLAPGYAYSFDSEWADKIGLALRFDLVRGVYTKGAKYLDYGKSNAGGADYISYEGFKKDSMVVRFGVTANFFAKDIKGVRSFAGVTFLMQPEAKIVGKSTSQMIAAEDDYGFTTIMLSAGAEM